MKRKFKGRFPDAPKLRPADKTVDGKPLIVRKPHRKNGRFPALATEGEVVDCAVTNPDRVFWYRQWRCGDVEIVEGSAAKNPRKQPPKPPALPAEED